MIANGWPELLNRHLPRHWQQTGLELGWVAVVWLTSSPKVTIVR
jgi:transposase